MTETKRNNKIKNLLETIGKLIGATALVLSFPPPDDVYRGLIQWVDSNNQTLWVICSTPIIGGFILAVSKAGKRYRIGYICSGVTTSLGLALLSLSSQSNLMTSLACTLAGIGMFGRLIWTWSGIIVLQISACMQIGVYLGVINKIAEGEPSIEHFGVYLTAVGAWAFVVIPAQIIYLKKINSKSKSGSYKHLLTFLATLIGLGILCVVESAKVIKVLSVVENIRKGEEIDDKKRFKEERMSCYPTIVGILVKTKIGDKKITGFHLKAGQENIFLTDGDTLKSAETVKILLGLQEIDVELNNIHYINNIGIIESDEAKYLPGLKVSKMVEDKDDFFTISYREDGSKEKSYGSIEVVNGTELTFKIENYTGGNLNGAPIINLQKKVVGLIIGGIDPETKEGKGVIIPKDIKLNTQRK